MVLSGVLLTFAYLVVGVDWCEMKVIHRSCSHHFIFLFLRVCVCVLAVAAASDVEADVIKAVEDAIASRPSRQGTVFVKYCLGFL